MSDEGEVRVPVRLIGPAKVGARWLNAGDQLVSADEQAALKAAGLIERDDLTEAVDTAAQRTFTVAEWEAAVQAAALKLAGAAFDGELGRLENEVKEIEAMSEASQAELKAQITHLEGVIDGLQTQLASRADEPKSDGADEVTPPATDTPPSEKATKTAPKKGAAATTKG